MTNHTAPTQPSPAAPRWMVLLFAAGLLTARLLAAHFQSFFQNDEVSLAAGVASVMQGAIGDAYRYGPQVGYYRLVELVAGFGGDPLRAIPGVMITLSALAGTVIPVCGLFLFPGRLGVAERRALAAILAVNPIIWMSSAYGNSAMPSIALLVVGLTVLSRQPGRGAEVAALAACGAAIIVRADAVLAVPAVVLLLLVRYGRIAPVALRSAALAIGLAAVYGTLLLTDPRMASAASDVAEHLTNPRFTTRFWEYLLWSTSPLLLAAAVLGMRELGERDRVLLGFAAVWCVPFFAFYFGSTTSPRYFVPTAVPLALLSAAGLVALVPRPGAPFRRLAACGVVLAASAHLFVSLGHFAPGSPRNLLRQAAFETHVGPMWTGAMLYQSYLSPGLLVRSVRHGGFGMVSPVQRELDSSLAAVAAGAEQGRTIAVLLDGWNGHVYYYYSPAHGATYQSRAPGPVYATETWMALGGARLLSIAARVLPDALPVLPLTAGDAVWVLSPDKREPALQRAPLSEGLALAVQDTTGYLISFRVEERPR